jgi:hypothetical protein
MADHINPSRSSAQVSSSALLPSSHHPDASAIRPRNRRLISAGDDNDPAAANAISRNASRIGSPRITGISSSGSRGVSPLSSTNLGAEHQGSQHYPSRSSGSATFSQGLLDRSWAPTWTSVQEFASSLLSGGDSTQKNRYTEGSNRNGRRSSPKPLSRDHSNSRRKATESWGPPPPAKSKSGIDAIAAGSLAERDAALKAAKTASILESHEGVNGGLDVAGRYKRRTSDEIARDQNNDETQDQLVYIHHVQPNDTYAGTILRYKCREDAFRKSNGLWSRDNIQVRKWLAIPVDACEIRGRPCEAPSYFNQGLDLLALTPDENDRHVQRNHGDFFGQSAAQSTTGQPKGDNQGETPWTHVRWVTIDSFPQPVEIARVSRKAMGYFPPRRKRSIPTVSSFSTPRQSLEFMNTSSPPADVPAGSFTSSPRRHSLLNNRPQISSTTEQSTPAPTRSRVGSGGPELKPGWMRRPGGVGSLGRNVRSPGPEKDYFNSWAKTYFPGMNLDSLPSMSVMGSARANFGFESEPASVGIVESPFEEGRDVTTNNRNGTGLDRAAAAVETWLRGAFARQPSTPILGSRNRQQDGDLIELADTNSDDGRLPPSLASDQSWGVLDTVGPSSTGRRDGDSSSLHGRMSTADISKGKKSD